MPHPDQAPAVLNTHGQPVDVGRERRLFTGAPRTAIEIRDGGCAWPGCARPASWCQMASPRSTT